MPRKLSKRQQQRKVKAAVAAFAQVTDNLQEEDFGTVLNPSPPRPVTSCSPSRSPSRSRSRSRSLSPTNLLNVGQDECNTENACTDNICDPTSINAVPSPSPDDLYYYEPDLDSDNQCSSSDSESDEGVTDNEPLRLRLRLWALKHQASLTHDCLHDLLTELAPYHPDLPRDGRTLLETPRRTVVRPLLNGGYSHIGLVKGLQCRLKSGTSTTNEEKEQSFRLGVDINIDGLPLYKSSITDVWPILGRCVMLEDSRPFVIGVFCGTGKPQPLETFLEDYIHEVQTLENEGLVVNGRKYEVYIRSYICDAPARSYIKRIKSHSGRNGCERCLQEGEHDGTRMCYEPTKSVPRTEESFRAQEDESHHTGVSPLCNLPSTSFISGFPLDPMHLIFEGVLKRFLFFLTHQAKPGVRLRGADTMKISENQEKLFFNIPQEFSRKPRSLSHISRWKATELRLFLLYTGPVTLKGVLCEEMYSIFLLLHTAVCILSTKGCVQDHATIDYAERLIETFVNHCSKAEVFGPGFVSYNIHSFLHLCDDVRKYGDISLFSVFPFENFLGILKRLLKSPTSPLQQLVRRLAERDFLTESLQLPSRHFTAHGCIEGQTNEFKNLSCSDFTLSSVMKKDSYFKVGSAVASVKKIRMLNGTILVIADLCDHTEDFYMYPCKSSKLGIVTFGAWTQEDVCIPADTIRTKCVVLLCYGQLIAFPLFHSA